VLAYRELFSGLWTTNNRKSGSDYQILNFTDEVSSQVTSHRLVLSLNFTDEGGILNACFEGPGKKKTPEKW